MKRIIENKQIRGWRTFTLILYRGGPQWIAYNELDFEHRKEWDAFESILLKLSEDKNLLVCGSFSADFRNKAYYFHADAKDCWTGACLAQTESDLHDLLIHHPDEYYSFVVVARDVDAETLTNVLGPHLAKSVPICDLVVGHDEIFCGVEECIDRNRAELVCHVDDYDSIVGLITTLLSEYQVAKKPIIDSSDQVTILSSKALWEQMKKIIFRH
ncbi:hypothetical protein STSP2_00743 [Anaerohalosphaera lusitana]|uniref:Uncharacterized protein n=1 Tax=Anaerohalosphaera lusitana TaxID=1936003 RepID=A0A1U9NIE6_9BACT|nr:hypothetical protein [Anaerohalosphaera lusitana]AQT67595.1 hypothetical protein STSP2_00743 [Anaerohalosphaera lusitana]